MTTQITREDTPPVSRTRKGPPQITRVRESAGFSDWTTVTPARPGTELYTKPGRGLIVVEYSLTDGRILSTTVCLDGTTTITGPDKPSLQRLCAAIYALDE